MNGTAHPVGSSCRRFPLSSLGLTDDSNLTCEHFASRSFDFADIRQHMKKLQ
ncbi:DNA-binding domain-containing protein [Geobacillus sp. PA-3]|uniref:DNA-binding domain-containing protein n=1 Tax=Geobacillus sp. PA-3 TaxID=1699078 RepID=UPI001ED9B38D|nr:DNA-binding domain-containing protein [Geobacillus sp. PA-3]